MLWYWHVLCQDVAGKLWDFNGYIGYEDRDEAIVAVNEFLESGGLLEKLEAEGCPDPRNAAVLGVDAILQ